MKRAGRGAAAAQAAAAPEKGAADRHAIDAATAQVMGWVGEFLSAQPNPMLQLLLGQFSQLDVFVEGVDAPQNLMVVACVIAISAGKQFACTLSHD